MPDPGLLLDGGAAGLILAKSEKPLAWHEICGSGKPLAGKLPMMTLGFGDAVRLVRNGVSAVELHISTTILDVVGRNAGAPVW